MTAATYKPDAPFRKDKKTVGDSYVEGIRCAREWRPEWDHVPGGPWVALRINKGPTGGDHPDWIAYCELTKRRWHAFMQGWVDGMMKFKPGHSVMKKDFTRDYGITGDEWKIICMHIWKMVPVPEEEED